MKNIIISGIYKGMDQRGTMVGGKTFPKGVVRSGIIVTRKTLDNLVLGENAGWFQIEECSEPELLKTLREAGKAPVKEEEPEAEEVKEKEPEAEEVKEEELEAPKKTTKKK